MLYKFYSVLCFLIIIVGSYGDNTPEKAKELIVELSDEKWDQIQKGQWLVGFFDKDTKESSRLEEDWNVFAVKCKEQNINVARAYSSETPGLHVRFLVTDFPKVFYIKNGVAHEVLKVNRQTLIDLIKDKKWDKLKAVNFLSNPFSVQMSLLSHLFVHAVNLYLLTCAFGALQVLFMDSKDSEEREEDIKDQEEDTKKQSDNEDNEDGKEVDNTSEDSSNIRKRK
ncbi:thioredoxin-related transmembrane protein 1-like isoform X2 [Stegodyphus dumicola]|uniref:thioredoxin-related transmembrane protein 1-like isoform X2 n=1 Tax=Stegodyphus dumicola TaxID=202533 RepID=UPI0015A89ED8|nr:thioredoxin-related transmembrane protein 1-like isoform X2 [Stegodyphus dumicola]